MPNLCCILDTSKEKPIICKDCKEEWCRACWPLDRTHRTENFFRHCPKTGRKVHWSQGSYIEGYGPMS